MSQHFQVIDPNSQPSIFSAWGPNACVVVRGPFDRPIVTDVRVVDVAVVVLVVSRPSRYWSETVILGFLHPPTESETSRLFFPLVTS